MALSIIFAVFSMILEIGVGCYLGNRNIFSKKTVKEVNKFIFDFAMPLSFFMNIYVAEGQVTLGIKETMIIIGMEIFIYVLTMFIAKRFYKTNSQQAALQQCLFRSNMILYGNAISAAVLTETQVAEYSLAMLIVFPIQNFGSVIAQGIYSNSENERFDLIEFLKKVFLNPMTIAIFAGYLFKLFNLRFPDFVASGLKDLAVVATPLGCILMGTGLNYKDFKESGVKVSISVFMKLFIFPFISFAVIKLFALSKTTAFIMLLLSVAPSANTVYNFALNDDWDIKIVTNMIVLSVIVSIPALVIWMQVLSSVM